ncbi:hypothetical protein K474DRAFT_6414 [Panus rudis PR-1116 ss-1]|nr:hypothetical protein K474DRAFT_6414 [Panus rudis PR-1116 ss-1]
MPSEHITPAHHDQPLPDQSQSQIKLCSSCHSPLASDALLLNDSQEPAQGDLAAIICSQCRLRFMAVRAEPSPRDGFLFPDVERTLLRRAASLQDGGNEADDREHALHIALDASTPSRHPCPDADMDIHLPGPLPTVHSRPESLTVQTHLPGAPATSPRPALSSLPAVSTSARSPARPRYESPVASTSNPRPRQHTPPPPDPYVDITRIRVRSQGHHCLYPGATFQGTQKSGRNSYDVNVTIVDVDFSSSHLCGYLRIRGLTDDWPELTTYFDAEIIGSRYGFLTRNWGASEQEDMVHWARFPAFRQVRGELKKPHLTMNDADRGAVFMRWKEKFLVPDHRVQDINGASFAGFYYVCVDFNPQHTGSLASQVPQPAPAVSSSPEEVSTLSTSTPSAVKPELSPRARRESVNRGVRRMGRSTSRSTPASNVATMSGFYFHQHSEPYQQLSLVHVPEHTSSSFEFR